MSTPPQSGHAIHHAKRNCSHGRNNRMDIGNFDYQTHGRASLRCGVQYGYEFPLPIPFAYSRPGTGQILIAPAWNPWNGCNPGLGSIFPIVSPDPARIELPHIDFNFTTSVSINGFRCNDSTPLGISNRIARTAAQTPKTTFRHIHSTAYLKNAPTKR